MISGAPFGPVDTRARARSPSLSLSLAGRQEWRVNPIAGLSEMIPVRTYGKYDVALHGRSGFAPRSLRDRPRAVRRARVASCVDFDGKQNGAHAGRDRTRYGRTAKMACQRAVLAPARRRAGHRRLRRPVLRGVARAGECPRVTASEIRRTHGT